MHVSITVPTEDPREVRTIYPELERIGYDRAFSFEAKHDPFIPLAVAGEHTDAIELGTAIAIAFARTPMTLANAAWDLQTVTGGRFVLGLGSQIRPHIEQRYSMPWSKPAARMRELVLGDPGHLSTPGRTATPLRLRRRVLHPHPDDPGVRSRARIRSVRRRSSPPASDRC